MARLILPPHGGGPQNLGEQRVIQFLMENLPPIPPEKKLDGYGASGQDEYILIPNIEIPDTSHRFLEIDAVLIAPHAVYVIEIKDWGTVIDGNDKFWYLNGNRERKNPHRTLNYKCRVLRSMIGKSSPDLFKKVWYQGVVIIARDNTILGLEGNCKYTTYILDKPLIGYLKDPLYLSTPKKVDSHGVTPFQKEIVNILINEGRAKKDGPQIIEGYQVEETLFIQEDLVEYLGRSIHGHKHGQLKRLRVFTLPLYADAEEKKKIEERIMRDFNALEAIGTHPNIVGLKGFHEHESDQVVEVLDWAEEGTLRMLMDKGTLTFDQKIGIIQNIAQGLQAAHEKGVVHRDVRPENILMAPTGPQLMNFDRAYLIESKNQTVWTIKRSSEDLKYLPPELALPMDMYDVYDVSDLYSLGAIFYELLCGDIPFENPDAFKDFGGVLKDENLASNAASGIPDWVDEVIEKLYVYDVKSRYSDAASFLKDLYRKMESLTDGALQETPSDTESDGSIAADPNRIYQVGERVGEYRITRHIKSGGFSQVYQATHTLHDKEYALKVNNQSVPLSSLIDEFKYLNELEHPNIVKVYWSGQLAGGRYYLAMEYLKGEPLSDYAWGRKNLTAFQILQAGKDVLSALRYLHEGKTSQGPLAGKALLHRDIKPNNIIWVQGQGFILIDFNIAKEAVQCDTFVGTRPYIPPDLIQGACINWNDSGDTFALGVTLYELFCKKHPYPNSDPRFGIEPQNPCKIKGCENLSDNIADFLCKAVQPNSADRFKTAAEMEEALNNVLKGAIYKPKSVIPLPLSFNLTSTEKGLKNYNPFVKRLCRLFSQAKNNNAGTRGLDEIAKRTYIPTKLDNELIPAIMDGHYRLVIITGNAGDGKTAFIQQLEARAENVEKLSSKNGSQFKISGIPFESNYDGSQDEGDINNDDVLYKFFKPFEELTDYSNVNEGRILAINEGRLMEFLGAPERRNKLGFLYESIDQYFNERDGVNLPPGMILVNLNWRSIVAGTSEAPSILDNQLQAFLKDEFWTPCQQCEYKSKCFIYYNALSLADKIAGPEIRGRLANIFEAVHFRRRLHITMRDLRSALSFMICRDHSCEDIPHLLNKINMDSERLDYVRLSYWNITETLDDVAKQDRLIRLLRQVDIGRVAQPALDRDLYFLPSSDLPTLSIESRQSDIPQEVLIQIHDLLREQAAAERDDELLTLIKQHHALMIRKLYFEGRIKESGNRLPYRHINWFIKIIQQDLAAQEKARKSIIEAISIGEGCQNRELAQNNICIAASQEKDPRFASYRLFPESEFEIHVPRIGNLKKYLEFTQDRFLLRHKEHHEIVLEVNLDLFELMTYVAQGFTPSLNDLYGRYIELIIFKNTLQHLPYRSVIITKDHHHFSRITATEDNQLVLERA